MKTKLRWGFRREVSMDIVKITLIIQEMRGWRAETGA
jgi:hypothetical protein